MSVALVILIVVLTAVIAAGATWMIAYRKPSTAKPGARPEVLDDDPTPVPAAPTKTTRPTPGPTTGPTWSAVVDRIPLGVVVMGSGGQVVYRNASAKAVAGTYTGLLIDDAVQAALREAIDGRRSRELLELLRPAPGRRRGDGRRASRRFGGGDDRGRQ